MLVKALLVLGGLNSVLGILNFNIRGNSPLFQGNNNRIKDTFMLGILKGKNSVCTGTPGANAGTEGVCKPHNECRREGGTGSGTCALVGVCCILGNTCGNTTRSKVSYFSSPQVFQSSCGLNIQLYSPSVCQIRLDFERFSIQGPPDLSAGPVPTTCDNDTFIVTGATTNLGFDALCGNNAGQHIYIPVNAATSNTIMLLFQLQADRMGLSVMDPNWRIKITQLECGTSRRDFTSMQSALAAMYQKHKNKKNNGARNDEDLLAPPGCLQYFPMPSGQYESFNYNNGQGPMIANTNYAICFKRGPADCGIQHMGITFNVANNDVEADCRAPNEDWLLIPEGNAVTIENQRDYYCGISLDGLTVTSTAAGPLYVGVKTDGAENSGNFPNGMGFRMSYNILNNCQG